jgi:excisionase family DNA binding protein
MKIDRIKTWLDKEPTIRELDVVVWDVLQRLVAADMDEAEVVKQHSGLEHDDFLAAISYAVLIGRTAGVGPRMRDMRAEIKATLKDLGSSGTNPTFEANERRPERLISPRLLTVKQAAIYLGRTEYALRCLIYRRELPVVRKGRRIHLDRYELDRLIEKGRI